MSRALFAPFVAIALLAPLGASAQDLDAARAAYLDADFEGARSLYRAALEAPGLDRDEAIEALRYLIALDALLGDAEAARGHARSAVALDEAVTVPEGAPDEATTILNAARADQASAWPSALDIAPAAPMASGQATTVVLAYPGGPRSLVDELRLHCDGAQGAHEATGSMPEVRLATPETDGDLSCTGEARTRAGAVLAHASEVLSRTANETHDESAGGTDWPLILGISGGVAAAVIVAVVVGVVVGTASGGAPSFGPTEVCGPGWSSC